MKTRRRTAPAVHLSPRNKAQSRFLKAEADRLRHRRLALIEAALEGVVYQVAADLDDALAKLVAAAWHRARELAGRQ